MGRTVAIGIQDFAVIREKQYFYIDKSSLIQEWWESGDHTTLITRPRRFGKTLNMSMLECFFSLRYEKRSDLFEDLAVWEEPEYRNLQGKWPVISLSFARVKENNFLSARKRITEIIRNLYNDHMFLRESNLLTVADQEYFDEVLSRECSSDTITSALYQLSYYLYRYYGKKAILLLDEYDTPMQEAWISGYWEEITGFMRSLFQASFKSNPYLERAMMTGITRISKESMFSDLNHLKVITTTSSAYASSFGFTEEEVKQALKECELENGMEEVREWYDGFSFGTYQDIYNPWSIINYLSTGELGAYWINTSSNSLVSRLIREAERATKENLEELLAGRPIQCPIEEEIVYDQLTGSSDNIWSLLLAAGYLKVLSTESLKEADRQGRRPFYRLALTNREVRRMFRGMVSSWFKPVSTHYNDFIKALLVKDADAMNEYMNQISLQLFGSFDTGQQESDKSRPEKFYHGFVLGLMVDLQPEYAVSSNRESGFGRYDVLVEPNDKDRDAFILEFKVYNSRKEKSLTETAQAALDQIRDRRYCTELLKKGIKEENIYSFGLAFKGKEVLILMEMNPREIRE